MPDGGQQIGLEAVPISQMYFCWHADEHGEEFARKNAMMFMETSALEGHNIEEAFKTMIAGRFALLRNCEAAEDSCGGKEGQGHEEGRVTGDQGEHLGRKAEEMLQLLIYSTYPIHYYHLLDSHRHHAYLPSYHAISSLLSAYFPFSGFYLLDAPSSILNSLLPLLP